MRWKEKPLQGVRHWLEPPPFFYLFKIVSNDLNL